MLIAIYITTIVLSMATKSRKWNWIFYALVLCLLLWTSNGTYSDFDGYYFIFERINDTQTNLVGATLGWFWLCRIAGEVGLNYYGMSLLLTIAACFFLHELFSKFDANENIIWAAIFVFPLLINGIQIRFFLSISIVAFGLGFLIFDNKFSMLKFIACVLIATSIHSAAAIFAVLTLVLIYEKLRPKENVLFTVLVLIGTIVGVRIIPGLAKAYLYQSQYDRYIANSSTTTSIKWTASIVVCWICTILIFDLLIRITSIECRKKYKEIGYDIVFKRVRTILFLLGLTLPLLSFDRNFHRFIQLGYILDAIALGIYWKNVRSEQFGTEVMKRKRLIAFAVYIIMMVPAIYSYQFIPSNMIAPLFRMVGFPTIFR